MLPGDYIAMKLSGEIKTTASGLSEGILWDFKENSLADILFKNYGFSKNIIPEIVPTFLLFNVRFRQRLLPNLVFLQRN